MKRTKALLTALLAVVVIGSMALSASASVRMRVTGHRDRDPVVLFVPRRATQLATGHYAEALGVSPIPDNYLFAAGAYGEYGGPTYYGGYDGYGGSGGYGGYGGCYNGWCGPVIIVPPFFHAHTPRDSPFGGY